MTFLNPGKVYCEVCVASHQCLAVILSKGFHRLPVVYKAGCRSLNTILCVQDRNMISDVPEPQPRGRPKYPTYSNMRARKSNSLMNLSGKGNVSFYYVVWHAAMLIWAAVWLNIFNFNLGVESGSVVAGVNFLSFLADSFSVLNFEC